MKETKTTELLQELIMLNKESLAYAKKRDKLRFMEIKAEHIIHAKNGAIKENNIEYAAQLRAEEIEIIAEYVNLATELLEEK